MRGTLSSRSSGNISTPSLIKYPWSPGKEANPANLKKRNPSRGNLQIAPLSSPEEHACWNLRADDTFALGEIQRITGYLKDHFEGRSFPLANDVQRLGNNNEKAGLGMAIRMLPQEVSKAQAAFYLGHYLEKVGVFKLIVPRPAR